MILHMNQKATFSIVVLALIVSDIVAVVCCHDQRTSTTRIHVEPPFPKIFDSVERRVQIVSEYWDIGLGYGSVEEYLDIDLGRAAYIVRVGGSEIRILIDAIEDKFYKYKPYQCEVGRQSELKEAALGTWSINMAAESNETTVGGLNLHLFDAIGYWIFASENAFTYEQAYQLYSQNNRVNQTLHLWSFNDTIRNVRIEMTFRETATNGREQPTFDLRLIRKLTLDGELLRTYNIYKVEGELDQDACGTILQVPVGHKCSTVRDESEYERKLREQSNLIFTNHKLYARRIDLQVTATKFSDSNGIMSRRDSDTLNLELSLHANGALFMFRLQDIRSDIKHVIDYDSAKYMIDMLKGRCDISHAFSPEEEDAFGLEFANGMHLNVELKLLLDLFDNRDGYKFVKEVTEQSTKYVFFELLQPDFGRPTRVIKKFIVDDDYYHLDSVTVWFMNNNETLIDEMLYFSLSDTESGEFRPKSNDYDISEECYLSNDRMKNGRDYAWLEFTYPLDNREINSIVAHTEGVKEELHKNFADFFDTNQYHLLQLPRIELMFEDDHMLVRLLALDLPPPEIIFERLEGKSIENYSVKHKGLSPDLGHCSESCRLGYCSSMTFCKASFICYYSKTRTSQDGSELENKPDCDTYVRRTRVDRNSLRTMIRKARRLDYSALELPGPSEELLLQRQTDTDNYRQAYTEHVDNAMLLLKKERPGLEKISLIIDINGLPLILVPNGFQIYQANTLADLTDSQYDQNHLPAFLEGLSWFRYKPEAFKGDHTMNARHLRSIDYEQCALACTDTRCGSFSYCPVRKDCVLTANYYTVSAHALDLMEQDLDCFIMQRDYLGNFNRFPNVSRPSAHYRIKTQVSDPSECALECVSDSGSRCLAFDYCEDITGIDQGAEGICYFQKVRSVNNVHPPQSDKHFEGDIKQKGCTHYSRSHLADFVQIEWHKIDPSVTGKLGISEFSSKTLPECAESCTSERMDCYAFEYCVFDQQQSTMHSCEMFEGDLSEFEGESEGYLLTPSEDCHVYYLRNDSVGAQLRYLANQNETLHNHSGLTQQDGHGGAGLTIVAGFKLYIVTTMVSAVVGFGIYHAKSRDSVKRTIQRTAILFRVRCT